MVKLVLFSFVTSGSSISIGGKTGPMSSGVNGLRTSNVSLKKRKPTIEGLKLQEGINEKKIRKSEFMLLGVMAFTSAI